MKKRLFGGFKHILFYFTISALLAGCVRESAVYSGLSSLPVSLGRWSRAKVELVYVTPLSGWEENKGQIPNKEIKYFSNLGWGYAFVSSDKLIFSMHIKNTSTWLVQYFGNTSFTIEPLKAFFPGGEAKYIIGDNTSNWISGVNKRYSEVRLTSSRGAYKILLKFDEGKILWEDIELDKDKGLDIRFGGETSGFSWDGVERVRAGEGTYFYLKHSWICSKKGIHLECSRKVWIPFELNVEKGDLRLYFHNTTLEIQNEGSSVAKLSIRMLPPNNATSRAIGSGGDLFVIPSGGFYVSLNPYHFWPYASGGNGVGILEQELASLRGCGKDLKPFSFLFITGKGDVNSYYVPFWPSDLEFDTFLYVSAIGEVYYDRNVSYPVYYEIRGEDGRVPSLNDFDPMHSVVLVLAVSPDLNRLVSSTLLYLPGAELRYVKGRGLYLFSLSDGLYAPYNVSVNTRKVLNQCYSGEDECGCGDLPAKEYFHILLLNDNLTQVKGGAVISRYYVFPVQAFETYDVSDNGVYFLQWDYNANYTGLKEKLRVSPPPEEHAWLLLFDPELKKLKRGITVSDYRSIYALAISSEGDVYVSGRGSKKYIFPSFRWIPDREREDGRIYTFIARLDKNLKKLKGIYLFDEPDLEISRLYYIDGRVYALGYDRKVLNPDKWRWRVKFSNFRVYELDGKLRRVERIVKIPQVRDYVKDRIEPLPERLLDVGDGLCLIGYIDGTDFPMEGVDIERPRTAGEQDIFAVFLDKDLKRRGASIEIGGRGKEDILDVGVDGDGRVYIYGITDSEDFNLKEPVYGIKYRGCRNPFVVRISPSSK